MGVCPLPDGRVRQKAQALGGGHLIPTVKEYANSEEVMAVENMAVYVEQLENAVSRTPHPNWEKMSDQLSKMFQSCLRHEDEPKAPWTSWPRKLTPCWPRQNKPG